MTPCSGSIRPARVRSRVDSPAPFTPTSPITSPGGTTRSSPEKRARGPCPAARSFTTIVALIWPLFTVRSLLRAAVGAMTSVKMARRQVLRGIAGLAVAAPVLGSARIASELVRTPDAAGAPLPEQLHLQFGSDAAHQMAVSWAAPARVWRPGVRLGRPGYGLGLQVPAQEKVYTDALTGQMVFTYHAELPRL